MGTLPFFPVRAFWQPHLTATRSDSGRVVGLDSTMSSVQPSSQPGLERAGLITHGATTHSAGPAGWRRIRSAARGQSNTLEDEIARSVEIWWQANRPSVGHHAHPEGSWYREFEVIRHRSFQAWQRTLRTEEFGRWLFLASDDSELVSGQGGGGVWRCDLAGWAATSRGDRMMRPRSSRTNGPAHRLR